MTIEEAKEKCKMLEKINLDIWNTEKPSTRNELRLMFKNCWQSISANGYKILRYKELDSNLGYKVPKFKIREDSTEDIVDIVDNRGDGNHHGDCTTRCISFCTGVDYSTIQREQFANAAKAKASYWERWLTWRSHKVWSKSLINRGFCELYLPRKVSAKVFLRLFKDSGIDEGIIAAMSAHHLAAIDMKSKKILDTWNSAGCRIKSIFVPSSQKWIWTTKLNEILG